LLGLVALATALAAGNIRNVVNGVSVKKNVAAVWEMTLAIVVVCIVKGLERDDLRLNRGGIPFQEQIRFNVLAGCGGQCEWRNLTRLTCVSALSPLSSAKA
jgi:hypothetical protein